MQQTRANSRDTSFGGKQMGMQDLPGKGTPLIVCVCVLLVQLLGAGAQDGVNNFLQTSNQGMGLVPKES